MLKETPFAKRMLALFITAAFIACGGGSSVACRQRGAALHNRMEEIKRKAYDALKIGTTKAGVIQFYAENNIPLTFDQFGAKGTIHTSGCSPFGCGSNDAIIGVRVDLDQKGSVMEGTGGDCDVYRLPVAGRAWTFRSRRATALPTS